MLALMILYTVFSLWILSQPIVEQRKNEVTSAESAPQPVPTETAPQLPISQPAMPDAP
jgi:hypothetical protein